MDVPAFIGIRSNKMNELVPSAYPVLNAYYRPDTAVNVEGGQAALIRENESHVTVDFDSGSTVRHEEIKISL